MNKNKKVVLFGGSFDPLTYAHLSVIEQLARRFDKVIVLPCYLSPFKLDANIMNPKTRIKLLKKVLDGYENVKISLYEAKKKKASYSYLSVQHFKKKYKNLYFCIGSDGLESLDRWAVRDVLTKNAIFYVVERPFFPIKQEDIDKANDIGFTIQIADFVGKEGSSSLVRLAVAFDKLHDLAPLEIEKYIIDNNLYTDYKYITDRYNEFNMKDSRREHIYRTAKVGILLAKQNDVDVDKVIKALLFHDIGKYVTPESLEEKGIDVNQEYKLMPESIQHACTSAAIARHYFNETDDEILSSILLHSTGKPKMTTLEKIVFLSDYIEEGRDFEGLDAIRKIVFEDLDKGMQAVLANTIKYLQSKNMNIYHTTFDALEYYNNLLNNK